MTSPGFFDTLERQLGDGLERNVARRATRRRLLERTAGMAVAIVAISAAVLFVNGRDVAEAGVDVSTEGGLVYVRLADVEYRPGVIEKAARQAGLDVTVESTATGPSLVGRFVSWTQSDDSTGELRELGDQGIGFTGFVLPAGWRGHLELIVGRPPEEGELYTQTTNAVSEGEPLACTGILGIEASRAAEIIGHLDLSARWREQANGRRTQLDPSEVADRDDLTVARVLADSPTSVIVTLTPPGVVLPALGLTPPASC